MNCNDAIAALVSSLEQGTVTTAEQREHIRNCPRCRPLLDSARQMVEDRQSCLSEEGQAGSPVLHIEEAVAAAEGELHRVRARRVVRVLIGIAISIGVAAGIMLYPLPLPWELSNGLWVLGMAALISAGFFIPILGMIYLFRATARRRMYKRLKPGRMIFGVCLGIAEALNYNVVTVRAFFVLLLAFSGGLGFWGYMAFHMAMPVHPDDRQYLLRFRLRRWLARRTDAERHAG
jgi:phage shock protein PspC (stress-responsive transcriptional regulator)